MDVVSPKYFKKCYFLILVMPIFLLLIPFREVVAQSSGFGDAVHIGEHEMSGVTDIKISDVDNDAIEDIIIFSQSGIGWLKNLGNGTFGESNNIINYEQKGIYTSYDIGDFDGDGNVDIAWINSLNRRLQILLNDGSGGFAEVINKSIDMDAVVTALRISSVKNQQVEKDDVYITYAYSRKPYRATLQNHSLQIDTLDLYFQFGTVVVNDFNNDSLPDHLVYYVIPHNYQTARLVLSPSNNTFEIDSPSEDDPQIITDLVINDFDEDEDLDLLVSTVQEQYKYISASGRGSIYWYINDGTGVFSEILMIDSLSHLKGFVNAFEMDIDTDGKLDIVGVTNERKIYWYKQIDSTEYSERKFLVETPFNITKAELTDVNFDGEVDIVTFSSEGSQIGWFENLGNGTFSKLNSIIESPLNKPAAIEIYDMNKDGYKDIIVGSTTNGKGLFWYENLNNFEFGEPQIIDSENSDILQIDFNDLDGDGFEDLIVLSSEDIPEFKHPDHQSSWFTFIWYRNSGNNSFSVVDTIASSDIGSVMENSAHSFTLGDYDDDGDIDVSISLAGRVLWYENDGTGHFSEEKEIVTYDRVNKLNNFGTSWGYSGDYDQDNIPELITSNNELRALNPDSPRAIYYYTNILTVYKFIADSGFVVVDTTELGGFPGYYFLPQRINDNENTDLVVATSKLSGVLQHKDSGWSELFWLEKRSNETIWNKHKVDSSRADINGFQATDLDHDGDIDFIAAYSRKGIMISNSLQSIQDGDIVWYENDGQGSFKKHSAIDSLKASVNNLQVADLNNDGYPELIVTDDVLETISIYENNSWLVTGTEDEFEEIPGAYELHQNYPNPFNPTTTITYSVSEANFIEIKVYNILGQLVQTLVSEHLTPGNYRVNFNGKSLSSGVYFYQLNAGDRMINKKMLLMK